jgi:UDP-N-acetylenolpyruvoylglucosamine reductase
MKREKFFLGGIGGTGMAPLAIFLSQMGHEVCGFDDYLDQSVRLLLQWHHVEVMDRPFQLPPCDTYIRSGAIGDDDPLMGKEMARKIPILLRGHFLGEFLKNHRLIAVVGSHGKTTTTAYLAQLLSGSGFPCNYLIGGFFRGGHSPASYVGSPWTIAEVDESDGTINAFAPEITVALNLSHDHSYHYAALGELKRTIENLFHRTTNKVFYYSQGSDFDFLKNSILQNANKLISLPNPKLESNDDRMGQWPHFNCINLHIATCVARFIFPSLEPIKRDQLRSVLRRQQCLFDDGELQVICDYAHHPNEVKALLDAYCNDSCAVIFQPHRFSRTQLHLEHFCSLFAPIGSLLLLETYGAFEAFDERGTGSAIAMALKKVGKNISQMQWTENSAATIAEVQSRLGWKRILFVGAGDIFAMALVYVQFHRELQFLRHCQRELPHLKIVEHQPLKWKTTFHIGGNARFFVEPNSRKELCQLIRFAHLLNLPVLLLANGSNLLIDDGGFCGLVIHLTGKNWGFCDIKGSQICVGAGTSLRKFCKFCAAQGIGGFEFLFSIPGTMGGAVAMNAGSNGKCLGDFVREITYMNATGEIITDSHVDFSYRRARLKSSSILLEISLEWNHRAKSDEICNLQRTLTQWRRERQPIQPSAGCVFKNPPGHFAGRLIEEAGLKGHSIGGAQISVKHGNFIVNCGQARSRDVLDLMFFTRRRIYHQFNLVLEPEIRHVTSSENLYFCGEF